MCGDALLARFAIWAVRKLRSRAERRITETFDRALSLRLDSLTECSRLLRGMAKHEGA
jgi:hypothetical protein